MGTRKNGKVVYKVSKKANLNKKLEIDESKIKNSKKRTEALTKEHSSGRTPAKKTPAKKTTPKKTSYTKTGITGGAAQAAKEYRKKNPAKNTKKETKKKETKKKSNQLTSNEALLLQNLTRTGSKKVVEQGKKNAAKTLTTSKAKTNEYKNLDKKTSKKKSKQGTRLTSNESLLVQNLIRTGTPNVVNKGLKGAEKTLRTSKAKTDEYKNLNKKVAKQDEKFLNSSPFAYGVMAGSSPIPLKQTLERQTGQKINTSKAEKTAGYKAGYMAGLMGEYIATGGIARGAVEQGIKTGAKQLAKSTGKKTAINVVKKGQKLPKAVKKISTSIAADTITGIPTNTLEAGKEASEAAKGEKGKTFAKSLALNTALDVGLGGAMEAVPAAVKAVAKKSKIKKAGQTGNAKSPSRYAQNASETTALKAAHQVASAETNPLHTSETGLGVTANDSLPKAGAGVKGEELPDTRKFMSPETQEKVFEAVSKRSGAKIEYADLPEGVDGVYKNGVITISNKAQNPAYTVMKHELTHHIETSGNYKAFADFVENNMREQGVDVDGMIESIISDYKAAGKNLTNEEARKEFTAKFTEECLFNSEKSIERLARENPSLFRQVYEWIVDTINKIGASSETRFLIDAQRKYEKALKTATASADDVEKYLFVGKRADGIEVYRTSDEIQNLPQKERAKMFLNKMKSDYYGRTAKFEKNGQPYYARFEDSDVKKNIYGDKQSDRSGLKAKVKAGAEGDIFELVENAKYDRSSAEKGKSGKPHAGVETWDYYVKTVQVDNKVYDELINVRLKPDGEYVYNISLKENKKTAPAAHQAPAYNGKNRMATPEAGENRAVKGTALNPGVQFPGINNSFDNSISKSLPEVNNATDKKTRQLEIIRNSNKMTDDYHVGIRDVDDIKTFEEAMKDDESFFYGDFGLEDAEKALREGKVTVYSSKPIEQGGFVSTSKNMAKDYAGGGEVYSRKVNLDDVAWINGDEGQYANIDSVKKAVEPLENRVSGDELLDAEDNIDLIKSVGGNVDSNGYVTLYHRTSHENAEQIRKNGSMSAKEDGVFFSTSKTGYNDGYGEDVIELKVPVEKLQLDDIFDNEAHFRVPLKNRESTLDVSDYIVHGKSSLSAGKQLQDSAGVVDNLKRVSENLYGEKGNKYLPDARELKLVEEDGTLPRVTRKVKGEAKAARYEKRKIRNFDKTVKEALGVSKYGDSEKIKRLTSEAAEKMKDDTLTAKDKDELFNAVFEEGINVDMSFLEKYKGLKDELRNRPLKITDSIKADIADYNDFRKGNMGTLRLSKEGRDIDVEYAKLRGLYPELFPEKNTPAEMLEEISSVAKSIKATETKVSKLYDNEEAKEYIKYSREQFDKALDDLDKEMHIVKRYLKRDNEDVREAMHSAYDVKKLKREADRVKQNVLLSDEDRGLVDMLHSGKLKPENVSNFSQNSKNILEVYEAEKAVKNAEEPLKAIGAETKAGYMEAAENVLSGSDSFRDKKMGFAYNRETAERNLVDIAGKEEGERIIREFFTPEHENEALATRFKNAMRKEIKSQGVSIKETYSIKGDGQASKILRQLTGKKKISEAGLLQLYGEKKISKELLEEIGAPADKIENAVKTMRRVYNDLITAANEELVRHGYEPIEYRKDYFPHFEETKPDGLLAKIAEKLGFDVQTDELPTDIAGLTHTFRPGKKWFAHALSRTSTHTEYDAIKGFDIYIEGIADIIYHTEDIQKLRALEEVVRYKYSDKAVKDRIDSLRAAFKKGEIDGFTYHSEVDKIYKEHDNTKLSKFATWLRDYTDGLAGKKTQADRVLEHNIGRGIYNSTKALEGRLAANMVAVNPASWLTNFIPLVQGGSVKPSSIIKGMAETVQNKIRKDDFSDISAFLTNRKGSDALWKSRTERIQDFLTKPMKWIDEFTSEAIVRAKYAEEIAKGTNPGEAVRIADRFAADVIADRSKGSLPVSFNSKNPISKIFTMFQVEVNNQWSHLMKDIPRNSENVALTALAFTNFFVASYIFNDVYEHFVGRRPALDPIGWANEFMGDVTGKEVPNLWDAVVAAAKGQGFSLEDVDKDIAGAGTNLAKNAVKDLPFAGGLMEGGRVPISSALPNAWDTISAAGGLASGEGSKKKYWSQLGKEALKPATYLLPPVGGGQAKKLYEAGMTLARQGDYGLDKEGEQQLKYAVDRNAGNVIKGTLFGKYAMGSGQQYIDNGFKMLSAKKTTAFKEAVNAGMKPSEAESFIKNLPEDTDAARSRIFNSDLTGAQKNAVGKAIQKGDKKINYSNESIYKYSLLDKQQKEKVDELIDKGFTRESAMEIRKAVKGCSGQMSQVMALASTGYDMPEVYNALGIKKGKNGNGPREKAEMLISNGLSIEAFNAVKEASDANGSGNVSIKEAMKYLDDSGYSRSECYALTFALTGCKHKNNPYR